MTAVNTWRIATESPHYKANSLCGTGAKQTGGRWNRKGMSAVYTSSNIALACLETLVHLGAASLPLNRYLVRIDIPPNVWAKRMELSPSDVPVGWDAEPAGMASLDVGDLWLKAQKHPILVIPSVIVPEERNVIINPDHSLSQGIHAQVIRKWLYDQRLNATT